MFRSVLQRAWPPTRSFFAPLRAAPASWNVRLADDVSAVAGKVTRGLRPRPSGYPDGPDGDAVVKMVQNPLALFTEVTATHGRIVGMVMGGEYVTVVSDKAALRHILIDNTGPFPKQGSAFFPTLTDARALGTTDQAQWRRRRQLATPSFRAAAIASYSSMMTERTSEWLGETWGTGGNRELWSDYFQLITDLMLRALTGANIPAAQRMAMTEALETYTTRVGVQSWLSNLLPNWLPIPTNIQSNDARDQLDAVYGSIVAKRQAAIMDGAPAPKDYLQNLLEAQTSAADPLTDKDVRDELIGMLIGQEPVASGLAWASVYLATQPGLQRQAREEVARVLGARRPQAEDTRQLPTLTAIICEVMRLHPPTAFFPRFANDTVTFGSATVPPGTTLILSPYLLHRDPEYWDHPLRFDPHRWRGWLGDTNNYMALMTNMGPNGAYMPFGAGARGCVAAQLSIEIMAIVLANVLQAYTLTPPLDLRRFPGPDYTLTLRPSRFPITIARRRW